jgi:hypothetical protein
VWWGSGHVALHSLGAKHDDEENVGITKQDV